MSKVVSLDDFRRAEKQGTRADTTTKNAGLKLAKGAKGRISLCFDRSEFSKLMSLYSRQVALGHWKDYALDTAPGLALFSIYRHASERPIYAVAKAVHPSGRGRQYAVFQGPKRLKVADTLADALMAFDGRVGEWMSMTN